MRETEVSIFFPNFHIYYLISDCHFAKWMSEDKNLNSIKYTLQTPILTNCSCARTASKPSFGRGRNHWIGGLWLEPAIEEAFETHCPCPHSLCSPESEGQNALNTPSVFKIQCPIQPYFKMMLKPNEKLQITHLGR